MIYHYICRYPYSRRRYSIEHAQRPTIADRQWGRTRIRNYYYYFSRWCGSFQANQFNSAIFHILASDCRIQRQTNKQINDNDKNEKKKRRWKECTIVYTYSRCCFNLLYFILCETKCIHSFHYKRIRHTPHTHKARERMKTNANRVVGSILNLWNAAFYANESISTYIVVVIPVSGGLDGMERAKSNAQHLPHSSCNVLSVVRDHRICFIWRSFEGFFIFSGRISLQWWIWVSVHMRPFGNNFILDWWLCGGLWSSSFELFGTSLPNSKW